MEKIILIKYGELTTKKDNRKQFINVLYANLVHKLKNLTTNIIKDYSRMYIEYNEVDEEKVLKILGNTFGIHAFKIAYKVNTNIEDIKSNILDLLKNCSFTTFKVDTKRSDKSFAINSIEFSSMIGSLILDNISCRVNVTNPELLINIEIRKEYTYISFNETKGLGGYPNGIQGKGLLMLSGGIDSPVAGYLALKRGLTLDAIYFEAIPHTSIQARNKVINLARSLLKYTNQINLHVVPITKLEEGIYKNIEPTYIITILRRMMYRISEKVAQKNKATVLINGESIGQVASQTLKSIAVINEVVTMPVIRPVVCFDKLEIIDIAKKIETYDISILPYEDCCTIFVPKHPVINPNLNKAKQEENKINFEDLIEESINNINTIKITDNSLLSYENLL